MSLGLLLSVAIFAVHAQQAKLDDAPGLFTRVRSTERFVIALIREGYERSPTFRELVDTLQRSNVIVFVQPGACAGGRIRSCLTSVDGSAIERHIRISVDTRTSHNALIATMAHELQHAVEIAEHPEVTNGSGALRLYRQIAFGRCRDGLSDECETSRALATETKVTNELFAGGTRIWHNASRTNVRRRANGGPCHPSKHASNRVPLTKPPRGPMTSGIRRSDSRE